MEEEPRLPAGFSKYVLETREPLLIVENVEAESERYGSLTIAGGEDTKSVLFVPLVTGGYATGVISLQNVDREHAFSESDQQLLETLAGSLSVALENARLVHETRQRNAELAVINSVQDAIAGELDDQAIYDAVGDKIREIFDAQAVQINTLDETTGLMHFPYVLERGERLHAEPAAPGGFTKHVLENARAAADHRERRRRGRAVRRRDLGRRGAEVGPVRSARRRRQGHGRDLAPERRPRARLHRVG